MSIRPALDRRSGERHERRAPSFQLKKSTVSPKGVIVTTYERAGKIETGSFALAKPTPAELERRKNLR
jgi:hypothetical protein